MRKVRTAIAGALAAGSAIAMFTVIPATAANAQVSCAGTTLIPGIGGGDVRVPTTADGTGKGDCDLGVGNAGEAVSRLQIALDFCNDHANLAIDGDYGSLTEAAVKAFQETHGLTADGIFGPDTSGRMQWPVAGSNNTKCEYWG